MPGAVVVSPDTLAVAPDGKGTQAAEGSAAGVSGFDPVRVRLELESFHVLRAQGGQGGTEDETCWCTSSGNDKAAGPAYRSEEFSSVKKGDTRTFGSNRVIFDGQVAGHLILQIFCFEADQSPQLQRVVRRPARTPAAAVAEHLRHPLVPGRRHLPGVGIAGVLADINTLGVILMSHLRNEDDPSCARAICLDDRDLALLSERGSVGVHFNGDGHHVLKLKYASPEKVPFPVGTFQYLVQEQGNRWTTPIPLP
ncbi:hypothetical protein ACIQF5_30965 [Streptomyces goshikiensis]|uniref:hypothetical protein n=1 Tax=Streptomyces goshikiensis TaxID=1942 RepID=UPI00382A9534